MPVLRKPPMNSPLYKPFAVPGGFFKVLKGLVAVTVFVTLSLSLTACGGKLVTDIAETKAAPAPPPPPPPPSVPTWLGNPSRNFYGAGPWSDRPTEVLWEFETKLTSGPLHKLGWGGSSWPGQPSVVGKRVYFGSADSYLYCFDTETGALVWSFKTGDSLKATPTVVDDRIIVSGLDHHIYCLNRHDGSLIWKYKTGFEVDGSVAAIDGRLYFGSEDGFFYCLNLEDGALVYKTERLGSMEGSCSVVDNRIYVGTEQGDLYCLNAGDGSTIWKSRIGADSDSTPAVVKGRVYTAAEDGFVYSFDQITGAQIWKFKADGGLSRNFKERSGFWASPIVHDDRIYIGSNNGIMYCLTADKGELVWQHLVRAPIWGTAPVVDGRVVFGDKVGMDVHALQPKTASVCGNCRLAKILTPRLLCSMVEFTSAPSMASSSRWVQRKATPLRLQSLLCPSRLPDSSALPLPFFHLPLVHACVTDLFGRQHH